MNDEKILSTPAYRDCLRLFLRHGGRNISLIEREMRRLGHVRFHRRILYARHENGEHRPGWIERFGWRERSQAPPSALPAPHSKDSAPRTPRSAIDRSAPRDTGFKDWLRLVSPNMTWDARHHKAIIEALERISNSDSKRLMIFVPPRHGKSELVTVRYAAWRMQQKPEMHTIVASYNQRLADRFSRKIRNVILDSEAIRLGTPGPEEEPDSTVQPSGCRPQNRCRSCSSQNPGPKVRSTEANDKGPLSPFPFSRSRPVNRVSEWETATGGSFRAVGIGGGITGYGADLVIIDDPIRSRADAESPAFRKRLYHWFNDDLYTRLEPDAAVILIQTRWHEDDLAGRLIREMHDGGEEWETITLPALSEKNADSPVCKKRNADTPVRKKRNADTPVRKKRNADTPVRKKRNADTPVRKKRNADSPVRKKRNADTPVRKKRNADTPVRKKRNADTPVRKKRNSDSEDMNKNKAEHIVKKISEISEEKPETRVDTDNGPRSTVKPHTLITTIPQSVFRTPHWEALWPERFGIEQLEKIKQKLGTYSFSALYQQRPTPAEGGIFKREWFWRIVDRPPEGLRWARGYDLAVSTDTKACYTASFRCAFAKNGDLYIADGFRARIEYPEQRRYILGRLSSEPGTLHGVEKPLHGQALIQDIRQMPASRGHLLQGIKVGTDKVTRALAWSPLAEEGKLVLVRGPWIRDFIDEAAAFPAGEHDDQIDAVSLAVLLLGKEVSKKLYTW